MPSSPLSSSISALTLPRAACTARHHGGRFLYVRARGGAKPQPCTVQTLAHCPQGRGGRGQEVAYCHRRFSGRLPCVTSGSIPGGPAKDGGGVGGQRPSPFASLRVSRETLGRIRAPCPQQGSWEGYIAAQARDEVTGGFPGGVGDHNHPLPAWLQPAARGISEGPPPFAARGNSGGRGVGPRAGHMEMPERAPAHQGGNKAPLMAHGRASSEVT